MFFTQGLTASVETIACLAASKDPKIDSLVRLRDAYKAFLKDLQSQTYQMPGFDSFCYDNTRVAPVLAMFTDKSLLTDLTTDVLPTPEQASREALAVVERSLSLLQAFCPDLAELFRLAIHTIFYARSSHSGGGSVSTAIGVIWCSHRRDWSLLDVLEFLVHELTHTLVFLDELRFRYFYSNDAISLPENFAQSAILKRKRPLDKTFHSIVVGYEVLMLRRAMGYELVAPKAHPGSSTLRRQILSSIDSMRSLANLHDLATPRVLDILSRIHDDLNKVEGDVPCNHG